MTPSVRARVMREWRPFAAPPNRPPIGAASLDRLVPGVMKGLGLEKRLQESQVFYLWPQIVGTEIARHAQPASLRNSVLTVTVDHPVWLVELSQYHSKLMLQKIQKAVGPRAVRTISFRIG